jgi:hypothetical protein
MAKLSWLETDFPKCIFFSVTMSMPTKIQAGWRRQGWFQSQTVNFSMYSFHFCSRQCWGKGKLRSDRLAGTAVISDDHTNVHAPSMRQDEWRTHLKMVIQTLARLRVKFGADINKQAIKDKW